MNLLQFLSNSIEAVWLRSEPPRGYLVLPHLSVTFLLNHVSAYSLTLSSQALLVSKMT